MSKPRLTKEQKKMRKELIKRYKSHEKRDSMATIWAIAFFLIVQEILKSKGKE